ncbi:MAG: SMC-Scp complex subunit ScpB [gamma proteobacterium symbiont of Bathyaustriella thionipta]|nr:SMC-Scp complex subunit ScpB [gamma proteobacterium symbiont of Bathyaustriella thionipta]MCU7950093.1 SMC-Scp complex subunit ScpB [gamma proteobacterium symbiont of Bathyaustriella thionipta]MCU7953146.1 SMC-Scp complex subunit ScpB [gamma proteobacterium symbiont of Bathyaustriella thionipta]MCU7956681.1 SMC-Scp complex subunit ScpB [gamma proteobacterium symbiont of Bathyaustriella thionipta]MCU7968384.1 SMC-Scp complex subunit ScpB [gamma proteobacterium symbiont of Bathyaustriella thio
MSDEIENSPVIGDPDIRESLHKLSASEATEHATVTHSSETLKNIVEAAILAANKAISLDKLLSLFPEKEAIDKNLIRKAIDQLMIDYQSRGIELIEVSSGFRFQVAQTIAPWVSRLWEEKPQKYSRALLETLALVAYRQPVTRGEIEEIRGVSVSSQIMRTLVEREWVRIIGHRDVPGKPAMYATTKSFLDYFGLKRLDELPSLSEIRDLDIINAELDFGDGSDTVQEGSTENSETDITNEVLADGSLTQEASEKVLSSTIDNTDNAVSPDKPDSERINIDEALNALKDTYQKIDAIDEKNTDEINDEK